MSPIATVSGIRLGVNTNVNLFTVPAGKTFVFLGVVIRSVLGGNYDQSGNQQIARLSDDDVMVSINGNYPNTPDSACVTWQTSSGILADAGDTVILLIGSTDGNPTPTCSVDLFGYLV